jgi:hypothetical protein
MPRVRILSKGHIPFIGKNGPILNPVNISEEKITMLKSMGIKVQIIRKDTRAILSESIVNKGESKQIELPIVEESTLPTNIELVQEEEVLENIPEPVVEEVAEVTPEPVVEEVAETVSTPILEVDEETKEFDDPLPTIIVNDENLSADAYYNEDWLTKKKAITILTNRGIEFSADDSATNLKALVMDSNPMVQFEEEA